jgi:hypothetical protein
MDGQHTIDETIRAHHKEEMATSPALYDQFLKDFASWYHQSHPVL